MELHSSTLDNENSACQDIRVCVFVRRQKRSCNDSSFTHLNSFYINHFKSNPYVRTYIRSVMISTRSLIDTLTKDPRNQSVFDILLVLIADHLVVTRRVRTSLYCIVISLQKNGVKDNGYLLASRVPLYNFRCNCTFFPNHF